MTTETLRDSHPVERVPRLRRWLVRALVLASAVLVIVLLTLSVVIMNYGSQDRVRSADVIIVLGGGDEGTTRRAEHSAVLYAQGYAPFVLCTGGVTVGEMTEAHRCAQTLIGAGVPESAIMLEERSRSTEENAIESRAIMARQGWQAAVLVSDNFHLWRAHWLYHQRDITVFPSAAQRTTGALGAFEYTYSLLRELVAVGWQVGKSVLGLDATHAPAALHLN